MFFGKEFVPREFCIRLLVLLAKLARLPLTISAEAVDEVNGFQPEEGEETGCKMDYKVVDISEQTPERERLAEQAMSFLFLLCSDSLPGIY